MVHKVVRLGEGHRSVTLRCVEARTAQEQARGLQGHAGLTHGEGMLFTFASPRSTTFHMGDVRFPIDVVFARGGRIGRIVHAAYPGTQERWSFDACSAVLEVLAGVCRRADVRVGDPFVIDPPRGARRRQGQQTYNLLRTLTEAAAPASSTGEGMELHVADGEEMPPLMDGYYSKEPSHAPGFGGADDSRKMPPGVRFQDHLLPDEGSPNAMSQPNGQWEQNFGYQRPGDALDSSTPIPAVRPAAARGQPRRHGCCVVRRWAQADGGRVDLELDPVEFAPKMLEAAARVGLPWQRRTDGVPGDIAVVTPDIVGRWVHALPLDEGDRDMLFDAATSLAGLDALGLGFIAAEIALTARVQGANLVLGRASEDKEPTAAAAGGT